MRICIIGIAALLAAGSWARGDEVPTISYQSIPLMVIRGEIEKADLYDFGREGVDAVFTTKDGSAVAVKKTFGLNEDAVLQQYLKDHNIPFTVYESPYKGPLSTKRSDTSSLWMTLPMLLMFGLPLILIVILLMQARTIARQAETIRALVTNKDSQPGA